MTVGNKTMKVKLDKGAFMLTRAHTTDAGADLRTPIDIEVPAKGEAVVDTGVHVELPPNTVGMLKSKSGLNVKWGIVSEGVIDQGYTGSIVVKLYNHGPNTVLFHRGEKVSQLVVMPVEYVDFDQVDELGETDRGAGGFGSTGA